MAGNRDFLLGPRACAAAGLRALADPTLACAWGQRVLLAHGDAWCLDDVPYQAFRAQVRGTEWQQQFLARPLAERRELARQMRGASEQRKRTLGAEVYADLDVAAVDAALAAADASVLVHGHTHRPATHAHAEDRLRLVLSDWHCEPGGLRRAEVLRWTAAGFKRLPPAAPC
jgi:UDP-2,3-diacylglucosamine hydrolase